MTAFDISAEWAERKRYRRRLAGSQSQLPTRVRSVFVFLLVMTALVFAYNRHVQIQSMAAAGVQTAADQVTTDKSLRKAAINYEKQVDSINK